LAVIHAPQQRQQTIAAQTNHVTDCRNEFIASSVANYYYPEMFLFEYCITQTKLEAKVGLTGQGSFTHNVNFD